MAQKASGSKIFTTEPPKGPGSKPSPIAHLLVLGPDESFQSHYEHTCDRFRVNVQINAHTAYRDLVYEIKEIAASLFPDDIAKADLEWVISSMEEPSAVNFQSDMAIEQATEHVDPVGADGEPYRIDLNDLSQFTDSQQKTIKKLQTNAGTARHYLQEMHICLTKLRSQVSHTEYLALVEAMKVPQTKVKVVGSLGPSQTSTTGPSVAQPSQGSSRASSSSQGVSTDKLIIAKNLPRPVCFDKNTKAPTSLLGALVHYVMRLWLVSSRKQQIGQEKCADLFHASKSGLKRLFRGNVRHGGKWYM